MVICYDFEKYITKSNSTLFDCFVKFEENNVHTLLVLNGDIVIGSVTDGDIRKALIKSRSLSTTVNNIMNLDFIFVLSPNSSEQLFNDHPFLFLIPVINEDRKLLSLCLR